MNIESNIYDLIGMITVVIIMLIMVKCFDGKEENKDESNN